MDLSIIIPAYNEENYLPSTVHKLKEAIASQDDNPLKPLPNLPPSNILPIQSINP